MLARIHYAKEANMGIARAIRRVKRQAKQGGLNAVMTGLGEGLRSRSVPAPLRGAARKIAALIDPTRAPKASHHTAASHAPEHGTQAARDGLGVVAGLPELDPGIARPPAEVTPTGVDSGAEPSEPIDGTPVDPLAVGATPTYNATPLQVEPVDASPAEVKAVEVEPLEVSLRELPAVEKAPRGHEPTKAAHINVEHASAKPSKPKKNGAKKPAQAHAKPHTPEPTKEKLAADGEAAKSVARSGSRAAKKRASTRADTTSKKK